MLNFNNFDFQSDYLNGCFLDLDGVVQKAVEALRPHVERFEGIVVRGVSGLLVGPMVAALLKKPWCIIRKPGEGTHSDHKVVEGWHNFKTYIVIDDLAATGGTIKTIQKTLHDHAKAYDHRWERGTPECIGFYLYNCEELAWRGDGKTYSYYDEYFLFQQIPARSVEEQIGDFFKEKSKGPAAPKQVTAAAYAGQRLLAGIA